LLAATSGRSALVEVLVPGDGAIGRKKIWKVVLI
jgi:hypothetical protein